MAARILLGVVAVVVLAWLGVLERDTRLQARGAAAGRPGAAAAALDRAAGDLRAASRLNPDTVPDIALATVYRRQGENARAKATLEDVLRREPDNLTAWGVLFTFTARDDPATARRALAARRRLDPLRARRSR